MPRSPLTLAASVTSALPRVAVVGAAPLTEDVSGRYDSAVAHLEDGRRVVVRIPVDAAADEDLQGDVRALRALTPGVRGVLSFHAPEVLGQTRVDGVTAVVQTFLPGYRVDAAHVPAGPGVATALAAATASIHDLPPAVVRDVGLPVRTPGQVRDDAERVLDRAEATGRLPFGLLRRWSTALGDDALWRFEATVVLGGVDPASFTLEDVDGLPTVTGLLSWGGLSAGDPAVDLRWTASAPEARDDVLAAYARVSHRAPDAMLAERARLYAELEFAKWLVHGHEAGSESIISDAVALLESLEESVRDEPPLAHGSVSVDDAFAAIDRVPDAGADPVDTSMHTDTYDPGLMGRFDDGDDADDDETGPVAPLPTPDPAHAHIETVPIELSDWAEYDDAVGRGGTTDSDDPDEAARNALRRWTGTA